ncbi:MAG: FAD-dependent oxidoreductase [Chitinophagaceae bacterium]|nr:FAD-dependent oxidoreductase [Chitinophagaceae bacterium]
MKYIIIGGVAGGASTAARLRRIEEKAEIILFEKGEFISYANCGLPYYIGDVIKERNQLFVQTAANFKQRFNIDVRVSSEVTAIDPEKKTVSVTDLISGRQYTETYDKMVLSPGAEPIRPPLPGIDLAGIFTLRNVNDTDRIKEYVQRKGIKKAVVIGGGFIGLEMAENLHHLGIAVTVVEMAKQVMAPTDYPIAALVQQHIRGKGVDLRLQTAVSGFEKTATGIRVLVKEGEAMDADIVILSIGVRADTKLAANAGLKLGAAKGIWVNEFLQTSNPDIYAVGDAIEFENPLTGQSINTYLAGPANKQGRICANNIINGNTESYKGAINTAIVKIFDMTVGTTGTAAKHLMAAEIPHIVSTTRSGSHAGYYPGSQLMTIQIAFSPKTGRLLGAQVAGYEGADKRLDVLATIIKLKGTIYDLAEFEHAYAPPYSSAKDPVNMAGFVAMNILEKKVSFVYWDEATTLAEKGTLIDVRTKEEFSHGTIPGAINIPLDDLRDRMNEIPAGKPIFIYCQIGLRGYLAYRILKQNNFTEINNLSGGYSLWEACNAEVNALQKVAEKSSETAKPALALA